MSLSAASELGAGSNKNQKSDSVKSLITGKQKRVKWPKQNLTTEICIRLQPGSVPKTIHACISFTIHRHQ